MIKLLSKTTYGNFDIEVHETFTLIIYIFQTPLVGNRLLCTLPLDLADEMS